MRTEKEMEREDVGDGDMERPLTKEPTTTDEPIFTDPEEALPEERPDK